MPIPKLTELKWQQISYQVLISVYAIILDSRVQILWTDYLV